MRFVLIQDNDSHWYVCPADKADEASTYFDAVDKYWNGDMKGEPPDEPDYLQAVGGAPSLVSFTDPIIK